MRHWPIGKTWLRYKPLRLYFTKSALSESVLLEQTTTAVTFRVPGLLMQYFIPRVGQIFVTADSHLAW